MADTFRGPLYVARREVAPVHQFSAWITPSLLATVLAVAGQIPLPLGAVNALPLQISPQPPYLNADTTQGMSPVLRVVAAPFVPAPGLPPPRFWWQPADSTADTPKTLLADKQLPFAVLQQPVLDAVRPVADTSHSTPVELFPVVVLALPPGLSYQLAPLRFWWQPQDTTAATPKGLFGDAVPPLVDAPVFAPLHKPVLNWLPADTSQTSQVAFLPPGTVTPPPPPTVIIQGGAGPKPKSRRHWVIVGRHKHRVSEDELEILQVLGNGQPRIIAVQTEPGKPRERIAIIETVDPPSVPLRVSRLTAPVREIRGLVVPPDLSEVERIVRRWEQYRKQRDDDDEDDLEAILWSL